MKYKKIIEDKELHKKLKAVNTAQVARDMGVSRTYLYEALRDTYVLTEEFRNRLKAHVDKIYGEGDENKS